MPDIEYVIIKLQVKTNSMQKISRIVGRLSMEM